MKKPPSYKKQLVNQLRDCIRASRKCAHQINRKLEYLAELNKIKSQAQEALIKWAELNKAQIDAASKSDK